MTTERPGRDQAHSVKKASNSPIFFDIHCRWDEIVTRFWTLLFTCFYLTWFPTCLSARLGKILQCIFRPLPDIQSSWNFAHTLGFEYSSSSSIVVVVFNIVYSKLWYIQYSGHNKMADYVFYYNPIDMDIKWKNMSRIYYAILRY